MEEGTFPPNPGSGVPNQQNPWETPSSSDPASNSPGQLVAAPESARQHQVQPVVYRTNNQVPQDDGGKKSRSFPIKKILIIVFVILIAISVIAVTMFMLSSSSNSEVVQEDVTLTYWGVYEDEAVIRPVIEEFEKENPGIKVNYIKQDFEKYREKLSARTANNKGPDVFRYHNTWYPMISNILLPMPREVIEKDDFNSRYYDAPKNDLVRNGTVYGIPLYADALSLYINTEIFNKASTENEATIPIPKTWQNFIDASIELREINENGAIVVGGAGIGTFDNVKYAPDIISLLMAQNGVDLDNPEDYGEEIAEAIEFYTNFSRIEKKVWDSTQENSQTAFSQGKLAMFFGYSWDYHEIKRQNPNIQISIVPVPQLITDDPINVTSYWAEGISSASQNPQEAFLFMNYLARGSTQERLFEEASKSREYGEPYSMISLAEKLKDNVAFVFVDQSRYAISSPFVFVQGTGPNDINFKLNNQLRTTINNVLNRSSIESETEGLIQGYKEAINVGDVESAN